MPLTQHDKAILRDLAGRVADIAGLPVQQETIRLTRALNGLRPERPMVMVDQIPWHEMDVDGSLHLQAEDPFCRELETGLRRTLYAWDHMRADQVVEPVVDVPLIIDGLGYGLDIDEEILALDPNSEVVSHLYGDQLENEEDLEKITTPDPVADEELNNRRREIAEDIFEGLLGVRMQGWRPKFSLWDAIVQWRGAEHVLVDLVDRPDYSHRIIARLTDAHLTMLDRLEARGLLVSHQPLIHCTGAYTDDLPADGFDPTRPRAKDLWTYGMAQILGSVSPAMHKEFDLDYAVRWYERMGLVYYGCCEPLDRKLDIVTTIPNLRKVSMSPWVDVERGAEGLGSDFVFSRKPPPSLLAQTSWDPEAVEQDLRSTIAACKRSGCPLELILKDISTVNYEPQRLWEWTEIAMRVVRE